MRRKPVFTLSLYFFFILSGSVYGIGEKIITLGSDFSWTLAEKKQGLTETSLLRPYPVLVLSEGTTGPAGTAGVFFPASRNEPDTSLDLSLSFDESRPVNFSDSRGCYDVFVSADLAAVSAPWSRIGPGAALFPEASDRRMVTEAEVPLVIKPRKTALFASGSHVRDFSIEFWLYPQTVENGGQILFWSSSMPDSRGGYANQQISCVSLKNRYQWVFGNFFFSPDEKIRKDISFSGPPVVPKTWSHHLVRFDADIGLLEYLVDGRLEALNYTTASGREGGDVYTPVIGENCRLELGSRFSGMMDEFRIHRNFYGNPSLAKYPSQGGRMETRTLDLGSADSRILKIEALGGRTSNSSGKIRNEYAGSRSLSFQDHSEIRFFVRMSNSPYLWNNVPWVPVNPGEELPDAFRGRYIQAAADFYPGEDGETTPYLSEFRIIYRTAEPPPPPSQVMAIAKDGAVELSWKASASRDVGGYLIYYGTARGEYFGEHAILGTESRSSPIDAGNRTTVRIDGLINGTLYYFAVAAYNRPDAAGKVVHEPGRQVHEPGRLVLEPGEFSREAAARPLRMAE